MFRVPKKRMAADLSGSEDGADGKKVIKLSTKVCSIMDRKKDHWNVDKAHQRVANEMKLYRCFFSDDFESI